MNCRHCNTPLPDEARFCISCGADLSDPGGGPASTTAAMDAAAAEELLRLVKQEVGPEFEVQRKLGQGGMAVVYLAIEVNLGRQVAIKVLPPELTWGSGAIERFKREARTAATLDHPNIIPIYRISAGGRLFWYAMKYLDGRSLADILKQHKRLSLRDTVSVLEQVAQALDYAHARNVIHRDIKPANVMLDAQKRVIVTDFGIAKQLAAGSFTASGSVIGTPYYMSPEQCTGSKTLTGAADQYSVGVMAYEMLAGQVPFEGDSAVDILTKHVMQPPPPLDVLRPGLPAHVYGAIERALAKKPEDRFPTVGAFVEALRGEVEAAPAAPRRRSQWREAPTTPVTPLGAPRWVRTLTLAVIGSGALGGAALWILSRRPAPEAPSTSVPAAKSPPAAVAPAPEPLRDTARSATPEQPSRRATPDSAAGPPRVAAREPPPQPARARLAVLGVPSGGTVFIDGRRRSGTDFELAPGTYTVRIEAPGFETAQTTVTLRPGVLSRLTVTPRPLQPVEPADTARARAPQALQPPPPREPAPSPPPGVLVIRTAGGWGKIYVDGALKREGTSHREEVPPGSHRIRLEREGYATVDTAVSVGAGATQVVTIALRQAEPSVLVVNTVGGWARIYVDGVLKRQGTTYRDTLPPGSHALRLEREGYATVDTTVTVSAGRTEVVTITMRRTGS